MGKRLQKLFNDLGFHATAGTKAEYERALLSLTDKWQHARELPSPTEYYETLVAIGLAEHRAVAIMRGNLVRGSTMEFRAVA